MPERFPLHYEPSDAKRWLLRREARALGDIGFRKGWPLTLSLLRSDRNIESVKILVEGGYDLHERIYNPEDRFHGWSSLHFELYNWYVNWEVHPLLDYLLLNGADIHGIGSDGTTPTSLAIQHPLKLRLWVQALLKTENFDMGVFCDVESANLNKIRNQKWTKEALVQLFTTPVPRLKALYNMQGPQTEIGGYITWWDAQLQRFNPHSDSIWRHHFTLSEYRKCLWSRNNPRQFTWAVNGKFSILWKEIRGEGIKRQDITAFDFGVTDSIKARRYDTLIRIWPSMTNNGTPLTSIWRNRNLMIVCVRRWEWCMAILMRQS
jgi:hypothetical protein